MTFPRRLIPAEKTASSTHLSMRGQCSTARSPSERAKRLSAMASGSVTCFLKLTCSRSQGNDPQWTARPVYDLQGRGNYYGADRGQLVKVAEPSQPELAAAVHDVVIGKRRIESRRASCI